MCLSKFNRLISLIFFFDFSCKFYSQKFALSLLLQIFAAVIRVRLNVMRTIDNLQSRRNTKTLAHIQNALRMTVRLIYVIIERNRVK